MGMDTISIILSVERAFGIVIADEEAGKAHTVEDLLRIILVKIKTESVTDENRMCWKCDYSLRGLSPDRCPECGERFVRYDIATVINTWTLLIDILVKETGVERELIKLETRFFPDLNT